MVKNIELIGHTPMYQIPKTNIYVKLEKFNLGGSIKDRAVLKMLLAAMERGEIVEGDVLIEATSGNTGIALAMLGAIFHLDVVIFMPASMSVERRALVQAYGAKLVLSDASLGMQGAIDAMNAYKQTHPNSKNLSQFDNEDNILAHYETTGVEILQQVKDISIFVAGVGTGGSFSGIARRLKEFRSNIKCIAVEPALSAVLSGNVAGKHGIQGIGANFVPQNFDRNVCDEIMSVSDEEAFYETIRFAKEEGILVGISSGANIAVAKRLAKLYPSDVIVTIAPDGGEKYLSVLEFV